MEAHWQKSDFLIFQLLYFNFHIFPSNRYIPTEDLVNIYRLYYGDDRVTADTIISCSNWLYLARYVKFTAEYLTITYLPTSSGKHKPKMSFTFSD